MSPDRVRPGETVRATVTITGELSPRLQRLEFGLFGGSAWAATSYSPLASGSDHQIVAPQRWELHTDLLDLPLGPGTQTRTLTIPADAPGSCEAEHLQLMRWLVLLRGHGGPHLNEVVPVTVVVDPELGAAREALPARHDGDVDAVELQLAVPRRVGSGGPLAGEVVITARRPLALESLEVVVDLARVTADDERFDGRWDRAVRDHGPGAFDGVVGRETITVPVTAGPQLAVGESVRLPFSLALPLPGFTTLATSRVCTHALLSARLRFTGGSASTEVELNVPTAG